MLWNVMIWDYLIIFGFGLDKRESWFLMFICLKCYDWFYIWNFDLYIFLSVNFKIM